VELARPEARFGRALLFKRGHRLSCRLTSGRKHASGFPPVSIVLRIVLSLLPIVFFLLFAIVLASAPFLSLAQGLAL
jgi:hypothetical protein